MSRFFFDIRFKEEENRKHGRWWSFKEFSRPSVAFPGKAKQLVVEVGEATM